MMDTSKTVETYIAGTGHWQALLQRLRSIILSEGLGETVKWGVPVYVAAGVNVAGIVAFSKWVAIWFYQGVFIEDTNGVLISAKEGKTKALRQWRIAAEEELDESVLRDYIRQAVGNAEAGKAIKADKHRPVIIPEELEKALAGNPELSEAFQGFSTSHQREYAEYIEEGKREETRLRRLEKVSAMILSKTGLNEKYKKTQAPDM